MTTSTFTEYALSSNLTPDETYTVELLIELVRDNFDATYWDNWDERNDARLSPNYQPRFSPRHVEPATEELKKRSWVSFQRLRDDERPVRDISALRFLPRLSELVITNNEVSDLTPLSFSFNLRRLHLEKNHIRDILPLAKCEKIEELHIEDNSIADLSTLEELPNLRELSISADQISALKRLKRLPHLRKIVFGLDPFDSFEGFPEMPELRVIRGAHVKKLDGLEHFSRLQNLVNLSGGIKALEPLRSLMDLTHANILSSHVDSLEPLSGLPLLRDIYINTDARKLDLTPLESSPLLHTACVKCDGEEIPGLDQLRDSLTSWDTEFRAAKPRHSPSLKLHVVDQQTFNVYDTEKPFNLSESDTNQGLLFSELEWLDNQLEGVLAEEFEAGEDYVIPIKWNGARSLTVVLLSDEAVNAFSNLVLRLQEVLSNTKKDWIIYLMSDETEPEFIVWVYPDKIIVTHEYEDTVRKLINP